MLNEVLWMFVSVFSVEGKSSFMVTVFGWVFVFFKSYVFVGISRGPRDPGKPLGIPSNICFDTSNTTSTDHTTSRSANVVFI